MLYIRTKKIYGTYVCTYVFTQNNLLACLSEMSHVVMNSTPPILSGKTKKKNIIVSSHSTCECINRFQL